jgi:hypothetical protein
MTQADLLEQMYSNHINSSLNSLYIIALISSMNEVARNKEIIYKKDSQTNKTDIIDPNKFPI